MNHRQTLAIIGSGPSCIYLLKHLLNGAEVFRERLAAIEVFEKRRTAGMGMPYHPETTERFNMSNISSEELPELMISFADWLRGLDAAHLEEFGIEPGQISESEVYSRLALGEYLHAQYQAIIAGLSAAGISICEHTNCKIVDVREDGDRVTLVEDEGAEFAFDQVVLATGHYWPEEDHPQSGYYASPWPISKLLPAKGQTYDFTVGTLGASLSAFDVVSSLAHRHGTFEKKGRGLVFQPSPGTEAFRLVMHTGNGLLPHLQYSQAEPMRDIERHISEEELLALRDEHGFLRLDTYFDRVCRRVLIDAFRKDEMPEHVALLEDRAFGLEDFARKMTVEHDYGDAFDGMRFEMQEAVDSVTRQKPIHWKEAIDDLMYTLNFYAELMPAEDHLTLGAKFMPFLMNVIAALPLPSARILLALRDAGKLEIVAGKATAETASADAPGTTVTIASDGEGSKFTYRMFVDCSGQGPLELKDFPFPSLLAAGGIREARAPFSDPKAAGELSEETRAKVREENGRWFYAIGGIDIDRAYRLIGRDGRPSRRVADIAFPHTSGLRPYSYGLQACNDTARLLVAGWTAERIVPAAGPMDARHSDNTAPIEAPLLEAPSLAVVQGSLSERKQECP